MPLREGAVDHDGVRLHYLDWGGHGPPLILVHATGFLAALWQPIAERLAGRFRVVAYDQRGHGESSSPGDGYRFEAFADDLQRLIEELELERPVAVGHSSGGTTIVVHHARYAGAISRNVLIEPILPRPEWYSRPPGGRNAGSLAEQARKRRAVWPSADDLYRAYRKRDTFRTWRDDVLRLYCGEGTRARPDGQVELKCSPESEARFFEAVMLTDFWPLLPHVHSPTLVLWGAESHLHSGGLAGGVEDALPNARAVAVPGTTHFLPQEQPDEVARLIEEFLSD